MSDVTTSNLAFTQVQNTIYDSKVALAMSNAGILPPNYRVIKGYVELETTGGATVYPVLYTDGPAAGTEIILTPGISVIQAQLGVTTTIGTVATTHGLGLSLTSGGAVSKRLITARSGTLLNAGNYNIDPTASALVIPASSGWPYLVVDCDAATTTGALEVIITVV